MTDVTGERLLPDAQYGQLVHAEHLARYRLAAGLARGLDVLDVACGEGYGASLMMAAGARAVTGVDIDRETVDRARERYGIDFVVADIAALPFDDGSFDLVTCFETIEHVPDAVAALTELGRVLRPGGRLVLSTPNKHEYLVDNKFHTREFSHEEFVVLLRGRFPSVRLLYQHNWTTSTILEEPSLRQDDGATRFALDFYKVAGTSPGGELYTLAICGDDTAGAISPVAVAAGTDEAHALAHRLVDAVNTSRRWRDAYEEMEARAEHMATEYEKMRESARIVESQYKAVISSRSWRWTDFLRRIGSTVRKGS